MCKGELIGKLFDIILKYKVIFGCLVGCEILINMCCYLY